MERRTLKGRIRALVSPELEGLGFLAAFTERTGGLSEPPFSSLNLGSQVDDPPERVRGNRGLLSDALGVGELRTVRQVHGTGVREVRGGGDHTEPEEADALHTLEREVPLSVFVADCVPLALASGRDGRIAAVHAGWRGLASGILDSALAAFSQPSSVAAAIGPAIGRCHYEVGREVVEAVEASTGVAIADEAGTRPRLDLASTVEAALLRRGVPTVERAEVCTACEPDRFFSHRRDRLTGRQALVAMRL